MFESVICFYLIACNCYAYYTGSNIVEIININSEIIIAFRQVDLS